MLTFKLEGPASVYTEDQAAMSWQESHHNWNDSGDIEVDGMRYHIGSGEVNEVWDQNYFIEAYEGETKKWGPIDLVWY